MGEKCHYLIDGHQRVATLLEALYSDESTRDDNHRPVYSGICAGRSTFRAPAAGEMFPQFWVPLEILFESDKLFEFTLDLRKQGMDYHARDAERLANVFRDYLIPVVQLVTDNIDVVKQTLARINGHAKEEKNPTEDA
jgi:hypothetical protein